MVVDDDLGDGFAGSLLEFAEAARAEILKWEIRAVGRRPTDFMARDLMFASLGRDARCWQFRKWCATPPPFVVEHTAHLGEHQSCAIQQVMLHFSHRIDVERKRYEVGGEYGRILQRIACCAPYGLLYRWAGLKRRFMQPCRTVRLCPFCTARAAISLYRRISAGPWMHPEGKFLVVGRVSVSDAQFDVDDFAVGAARVSHVRGVLAKHLQEAALDFGAVGGITVLQASPQRYDFEFWEAREAAHQIRNGIRYDLSILAEVSGSENVARLSNAPVDERVPYPLMGLSCGGQPIVPEWRVWSGSDPQSLRFALVGSSVRYLGSIEPFGHVGAITWQPWFLASSEIWEEHYEFTKRLPLFRAWGSWNPLPRASDIRQPRGSRYRDFVFRSTNEHRSALAANRRQQLLLDLSLFPELNDQRPGHVRIRRQFKQHGQTISELDARWLANELKHEDRRQ